ncbi:glycoside hydrolase family 2 protein [Clostridium thermarum]|uniref:glycoside hydrolase family 2 protein n=1 Tax=Clostridium thermarum TaxID=1716543 RepID=UPI0013D54902|nr:glycoside hydrolase family 2 TIM barrel-domain containing protein [Clostridium thermarum]
MQPNGIGYLKQIYNNEYNSKYSHNIVTYESMIYDRFRTKEKLNGYWNFLIDPYDTFLRAEWFKEKSKDKEGRELPCDYSFDDWERVYVPACWNMADDKYFYYEGTAVYTRKFKYLKKSEDRVFLKFGAVNYQCRIFLNKEFIAYHKGGSTPFYIEVTDRLLEENRIHVVVNNIRRRESIPTDNRDWFNYGGIYRDVELIRLPQTFIKTFRANVIDGTNLQKIKISVEVDGNNLNGKALLTIPDLAVKKEFNVNNGRGEIELKVQLEPWSPDNPTLYTVQVQYGDDFVMDKVGFREISVKGTEIYLNGQSIYLKGICCHEDSIENGKALSEEEIIENIKLAKELNCNFMRLAHYPHSEKITEAADQFGIMLWEEIAVNWAVDFDNSATLEDAKNQLCELMIRDYNRASVIIWSIGNENIDTDARLVFMKELVDTVKNMDDTRLVSAGCLIDAEKNIISDRLIQYLDIIGINEYYGWYNGNFNLLIEAFRNSRPNRPVILAEFGAEALSGHMGTIDEFFTEDCQADVYRKQLIIIKDVPYIRGISPWILYDFRSPRRTNQYQKGYNLKGLLSADKKYKKLAYYILKKFYNY